MSKQLFGSRSRRAKGLAAACAVAITCVRGEGTASQDAGRPNQVLEWNQIFVDTLIVTNTANSSSQRLGAIVHTAVFDAYNGIERRYEPIFVHGHAPRGASRRAAVIAAAYTTLAGLFPARQAALAEMYAASLAALNDDGDEGDGGRSRRRGVAWGREVAEAVLSWRATDGFGSPYPAFTGGTAVGAVASDSTGLRPDERPRPGIHGPVRRGQQRAVPAAATASALGRELHRRFQFRESAWTPDWFDAN
jgi:hypothetical protein